MIPTGLLESVDLTKAITQSLQDPLFDKMELRADVLRLDLIHPIISGNKWFKLKYHLHEAKRLGKTGLVSFGGAFSNHLLATACAAAFEGLESVAIVRGEEPAEYSPTLLQLQHYGMQLIFVSREAYKNKNELKDNLSQRFNNYYWINEGAQSDWGIKGAAEILRLVPGSDHTYIICAVGTGTMTAGLINSSHPHQQVIGIPVLKIPNHQDNDLLSFLKKNTNNDRYTILYDHHEGGYAQKNDLLIQFMNEFYKQHFIPTDFVYTAKLFKAIYQLANQDYFPAGSKLLMIHSGGLQGNRSLTAGSLNFV